MQSIVTFFKKNFSCGRGSVLGGSLLIAGTAIGAGMLALPLATSYSGFFPALFVFALCWACMVATGLLFLEISMGMKKGSNIVSMAGDTLGGAGRVISWMLYLFLFYSLNVAYISGGGDFLASFLNNGNMNVAGAILFVALFGSIVYFGASVVGRINGITMLVLGLTYSAFVFVGWRHVNAINLLRADWSVSLVALPIVLTSFGFQGTVPTLITYMGDDARKSRMAIVIGATIPFIIYVIWEWLILGIVPLEGPGGLREVLHRGGHVLQPLKHIAGDSKVHIIQMVFAFTALLSSFFGVSLAIIDFLADGLRVKKNKTSTLFLSLCTFVPPLAIAMTYPHIFLLALQIGGGIGAAFLLGMFPVVMVWRRRYYMNKVTSYTFPGGKPALVAIAAVVILAVIVNFWSLIR